jgi:hypothetical protein
MSASKSVPKGLKNQECEKGNRKKRPPIPYVPVVNEVQEAIAKGKEYSYKIKLPDMTKFSVPIWDTGTQEAFLIHVQQAKNACKRKGLFQDYDDAIEAESRAVEQAKNLRKAIANAIGPKSDMSPEVHCNLCNHCYILGMPDPRPDIRCVQYLFKVHKKVPNEFGHRREPLKSGPDIRDPKHHWMSNRYPQASRQMSAMDPKHHQMSAMDPKHHMRCQGYL